VNIGLAYNGDITGTIPVSFVNAANTYLGLTDTSITGCVPKGVEGDFETLPFPKGLPLC
jgi:hypothetical protein